MNADGRKSSVTGNNPAPTVQSIATVSIQVKENAEVRSAVGRSANVDEIADMIPRLYL